VSEILFYHLTETSLEQVLPSLIMRSIERGWNVALQCPDEEICKKLDIFLWTFAERSFLPHGTVSDDYPEEQPVLLSLDDKNRNNAYVGFSVAGAIAENPQNYRRLCVIFDGQNAEELQRARLAWKKWSGEEEGGKKCYELTYWQQTPDRKWEKKA